MRWMQWFARIAALLNFGVGNRRERRGERRRWRNRKWG